MAEHDITQELLRRIQADLYELRGGMNTLTGRVNGGFAQLENHIRGLARVTTDLAGTVERIEQRLLVLEAAPKA